MFVRWQWHGMSAFFWIGDVFWLAGPDGYGGGTFFYKEYIGNMIGPML